MLRCSALCILSAFSSTASCELSWATLLTTTSNAFYHLRNKPFHLTRGFRRRLGCMAGAFSRCDVLCLCCVLCCVFVPSHSFLLSLFPSLAFCPCHFPSGAVKLSGFPRLSTSTLPLRSNPFLTQTLCLSQTHSLSRFRIHPSCGNVCCFAVARAHRPCQAR